MSIFDKIEEIKQKPENIRIRYVWLSVVISMFLIIIIWIFSFQSAVVTEKTSDNSLNSLKEQLQNIQDSSPSINELMGTTKNENLNNSTDQKNSNIDATTQQVPSEEKQNDPQPKIEENKPETKNDDLIKEGVKGAETQKLLLPIQ